MAEKRSPENPDPRTEAELRTELAKSRQYQAILEQDRDHWKWSHALLGHTLMSERERWRERDEAKIRWAEGLQSDLAAARSEVARLEWELREREAELGRQRAAYDAQADRLARPEGELREREAELGRQRAAYDAQADRLARLEGELAAARMAVEERDREVARLEEEIVSVKRHWAYRLKNWAIRTGLIRPEER